MSSARIDFLPREHVTAVLSEALSHPLTVLTAPTGYGKTTIAHALLTTAPRMAYLSVPQGADSPRYLWDHLCGRLAAQLEGEGKAPVLLLKKLGFPMDSASADRALERIRALSHTSFILILDDWHFADFPEFDAFLERLVRESIPGLSLFLLSRTRPRLPLEELRVKGLARIYGRELPAFSEAESVAYFALHGIHDAEAAKAAWTACEGWPAALWLSVQEYAARGAGRAPAGKAEAGNKRDGTPHDAPRGAEALLEQVVFPRYDAAEQRLLMRLSVLESADPQEAAALGDDPADAERLIRLHEKNAFLSLDPFSGTFRPHNLFRSFLTRRLEADEGIDKPELYRRAGECLIARGDLPNAAAMLRRAGREEDLLRLLELFALPGGNLLLFFSAQEIIPAVSAVPWSLRVQRPLEYLAFLYFCLAEAGDLSAAALLEEAEQRFADDENIPDALRRRLSGEAMLIRNLLAFNDLWAMRDIHAEAHRLLHGRSHIAHRHMIWNFACPHASYLYLREPGSYREMVELVEGNLHYFHDLSDGCSLGAEFLFRAEYLLERGEFADVEGVLRAAALRAESREQLTTLLAADFCLARLRLAQGEKDRALDPLLARRARVRERGNVDLATCLELAESFLLLCLGRMEELPAWVREGEVPATAAIPQIHGFVQALCGRAALAAGDWPRLEALAKSLPAACGPYENLFARIHAKAQEAVAARHLYDSAHGRKKALGLLGEAVELARPDGILLSLAEYGEHVLPLARALQERDPDDAFLAALVRMAERYPRADATGRFGQARLTEREKEILRLAAQGLSNPVIAQALHVSAETVKKTLSAAYRKLGAANRVEAVRRFMERR